MKKYELLPVTGPDSPAGWQLTEAEQPQPGPGQVLVRVRAVSLNYRDLGVAKSPNRQKAVVPCSDGAGEVAAVGAGVTRVQPGDRVAGIFFQTWLDGPLAIEVHAHALGGAIDGMLAEYVVLSEQGLVKLPEFLTYEEGACLPCAGVTAWNSLFEQGQLKPGQTVVLQGTGGVSILSLQLAKAAGARVIITSSSDDKLARARELGADETINYRTTPDWEKEVQRLTHGLGADHVVEVGGAGTLEKSFGATRASGHIAFVGVLTGVSAPIATGPLLTKSLRLTGIYVGSRAMFERYLQALTLHQLRPVIDRVFDFAEAPAAFAHLQSGAHFGKVVVRL
ncbi:NAD(P)-dependent alcohol dehydrogenase [Hymenobacter monticola]|uniref:NAD(P)-dependent alcohol dehydrogenase n=1 Tax=Hymenobacter monticola TaxID=1705399 RepID=A0ABY4B574_9BACT|nr:NAD(P)-dependent alcohol dehydrogenase [Hymenobacter monticola]UOE32923.1 NAD(P)-dependent alcohol dehydrogenase [Hymenobacter monticola]